MRAPVVRRHDGTLVVLANHRVYLKVSKTLLLIYNRRPQRYVNPVLDDPPGSVQAVSSSFTSPVMPEVAGQHFWKSEISLSFTHLLLEELHGIGLGLLGYLDIWFHGLVIGVAGPFHNHLGRDTAG